MNLFDLFESNRKDVDEGYTVVPSINRDRYTDLSHEGLEGPIRLKSGKVVYYDPKVGQYYDRDNDWYMSHEEHAAHELEEKSNNLGFKLGSNLVNRRQAHALTTGFKRNKFNFEEYEAESLDDEFAKFKNNRMPAGRAQNPFASSEPSDELSQRPSRAQNPFASAKPERVREIPRTPQISSAEEQQRTSQLNRCKQLLDVVNSSKRTDVTLSRIGNYIDKIDVNRFNPGELDNIEKYLSNYVAGAVSKKPRKTSKHGKVTMVNPDDVMAEGIGPDMDDPYEQGWYAGFKQVPNPYDRGTPEYARWEKGYEARLSQPNYYDEDVTEKAEPVKFSAKYPGKPKGKSYYDYYGDNSYHGEPDDIEIDRYSDEPIHNFLARTQRSTRAPKFDQDYDTMHEGKTGPGLWANIHAKQNRIKHGSKEHMRKPGSKGAPTAANLKAAKTESVTEGGRLDMSSPEEKAARKAYIKANGHPPPLTPTSVVAKYNPENDKKMRDYYLRRKGIPQDKLDKMKEDGVSETTNDPKFDKMLKGITGKKAVAKQQKADTKQQSRDAFGSMFGGGNPADALSIRKKGVAEGSDKKTMSRAAKGNEKYGKTGMKALAKAGREGKSLDKVRDKYNKYDESVKEDAKFGGYYKGTQKGAPRPGQSFGSMEESISLNTTVKAIANDIGEPITSMYATLKKMAKQYYDNNGDLKRFGLVAAGVGSRWFQTYYVNKMQTDLYDLTRQSPAQAAELKQFLRGKMVKDNLVMPKSFSDLNKELPGILARMGTKMGAEALANNAKLWAHNKQDYENFIEKLISGKSDDDDGDGYGAPATVDTPSKDALLGKQRNHAEEIVNDVLRKLPANVAGDIRNAIARAPNKLQALQQELQKRKIAPPMEEGIAGNMKVRSDPLTNLKQHTDIKMKKPDRFKGNSNHNNLVATQARNLVAKGAQTAGPGTGSHKNKALDVKKGLTRNLKHKGKIDFSESSNFLTWAVSSGYNVITNPAVYENAKRVYNRLLTESKGDLKPGQYYIWTVHFDDGDRSRIKIKDEKFDVKAYYKQQNKSVVSVDYNWEPQGT
jgi:hypothetical protein